MSPEPSFEKLSPPSNQDIGCIRIDCDGREDIDWSSSKLSNDPSVLGKIWLSWLSKVKVSNATSKGWAKSPRCSRSSDRGDDRVEATDDLGEADRPGRSRAGDSWPSRGNIGDGVLLMGTNKEGYGEDDISWSNGNTKEASSLTLAAAAFFAALRLFLEASGSLMKIHSFPREEHLEQGYCKLHFTFDSAHAYKEGRSVEVRDRNRMSYLTWFTTRFTSISTRRIRTVSIRFNPCHHVTHKSPQDRLCRVSRSLRVNSAVHVCEAY